MFNEELVQDLLLVSSLVDPVLGRQVALQSDTLIYTSEPIAFRGEYARFLDGGGLKTNAGSQVLQIVAQFTLNLLFASGPDLRQF